jgi:hypothetical protein
MIVASAHHGFAARERRDSTMSTWIRLRRFAVVLAMAVTALVVQPVPAHAAASCWLEYHVLSSWPASGSGPAGFHGEFTVHNDATATTASTQWVTTPQKWVNGVEITAVYSANVTGASPTYTFANSVINGIVAPGGTATFGVIGTRPSDFSSVNPYSARGCTMI